MNRIRIRRLRRGITMIETLVALLITVVGMLGTVGVFMASSSMTSQTAQATVAESLAKWSIEQAKSQGFNWSPTAVAGTESSAAADGSTTAHYGNEGALLSSSTGAAFTVVTSVVSNPAPVNGVVADSALRTVTVTVTLTGTGATLVTTGTYLTWGGV